MPRELVSVSRQLIPNQHQALREYIPRVNHSFPHLNIKWRRLGEAGLSLVERGEYMLLTEKTRSHLSGIPAQDVAGSLNAYLQRQPTEAVILTVEPYEVDFIGQGRWIHIAYLLDPDALRGERDRLTTELDRLNQVNGYWREFDPHLSLGTIEAVTAEEAVLDAFKRFMPASLTLRPANAVAS